LGNSLVVRGNLRGHEEWVIDLVQTRDVLRLALASTLEVRIAEPAAFGVSRM